MPGNRRSPLDAEMRQRDRALRLAPGACFLEVCVSDPNSGTSRYFAGAASHRACPGSVEPHNAAVGVAPGVG
eukprot:1943878-Heterocapsa_arctica.AAC.1